MTSSHEPPVTKGFLFTDGDTGSLKLRRYILRVTSGPDAGLEHPLESGTILIGTHENNDLVLGDPTVSRYHLEIQGRAEGIKISDLDSTNGTYMGDTRLGSVFVRGHTRLKVGGETVIDILPADLDVVVSPFKANYFGRAFGSSPAMVELFSLLAKVARTETTVLIQGETGTGKELLAEGLHQVSPRRNGPFVVVDCGAIPRELVAAELFGYRKGAFTGATAQKRGLTDEANGGTLFLDEIGELPLELQPQLLRLLEKREIRPIGDTRTHTVDLRVVAATNRDLKAQVRQGRFREDLYYRLAVVSVEVPPLRKRPEDIPQLARIFLAEMGQDSFNVPEVIMQQLMEHDWPGNVRELRNVVERGMSLTTSVIVQAGQAVGQEPASAESSSLHDAEDTIDRISDQMMDLPFKEAKSQLVEAFEREYLTQLLDRHRGNISRAASEAGIDRNYIHRLVKKYGIDVNRG